MNEFALIDKYFRRPSRDDSVRIGIGDDAAVIQPTPGNELVISVDMLVEGGHFLRDTDPRRLGHKTLAVNLSDLAAMGATPRYALLAGALPDADERWLGQFAAGFFAVAERYGVELIGGDTTKGPRNFCVTIIGQVPAGTALTRSGAKPGDDIYVSGSLGDAAHALAALQRRTMLAADALEIARSRLEAPEPRVSLGERLRGVASAALDISDGLTGDLSHILESSHAGAIVELASIPRSPALDAKLTGGERDLALRCLLAGGDDYELCFTADPSLRDRVADIGLALNLPLTRIGAITAARDFIVRDEHGAQLPTLPLAFDHFIS